MQPNRTHRARVRPIERLEERVLLSETASAHVALVSTTGSTPAAYQYDVALNNTGTTPLGSFWFAWTPGSNYLGSRPTQTASPAGWSASITGANNSTDGSGIEWVAGSTSAFVAAGASLDGFTFTSADDPSTLSASSPFHEGTPATTSFVYGGAPFADSGFQFVVAVDSATSGPTGTTTAVTSAYPSVTAGQPVTFTATVAPATSTGTTPTGTVEFFADGTSLGTAAVTDAGSASFNTTALPVGSDAITAAYGGDTNFAASTSSAFTETVSAVVPVESATARINLTSIGGTVATPVYHYDITVTDTGSTTIGTFWYAWLPGQNFLPTAPSAEGSPAGWGNKAGTSATPDVTGPESTPDGTGLRWVAASADSRLAPGQSLGGFTFTSTDSPAALAGLSPSHPVTAVGTSFVYAGQPFADAGQQFTATVAATSLLQPTLPVKLPTTAILGRPFNVTVPITITNFSKSTSAAPETVTLYAAPDGVLDGTQTAVASVTRRLVVRGDRKVVVPLRIKQLPAAVAVGQYSWIAAVTDAAGENLIDTAAVPLTVASPTIFLSATIMAGARTVAAGRSVTLTVTITNAGNVNSTGAVVLSLGLQTVDSTTTPITVVRRKATVRPAVKPVVFRIRVKVPATLTAGNYLATAAIIQSDASASAVATGPLTVTVRN